MTVAHPSQALQAAPPRIRIPRPRADKMVVWALYACTVVFYLANVYNHSVAAILSLAKWPMLVLVALAALIGLVRKGRTRPSSYFIPFAFVVLLSLSLIESIDQEKSFATLLTIALLMTASRLVAANFSHIALRKRFFDILLGIGVLLIASLVIMYPLGLNLGRAGSGRFSAWNDNPNTLGLMLAPLVVVLIAGVIARPPGWQWRYGALLLPGLFFIQQTGSRAAMLWVMGSAVAFWIYRKGLSLWALLTGLVLVVFIGWGGQITAWIFETFTRKGLRGRGASFDTVMSGRSEVWDLGMRLAHERPKMGYGLGNSTTLIEQNHWFFVLHQGGHFHNSYLTALVETGLLGLAALSVLLLFTLGKGLKEARELRTLPQREWPFVALPFVMIVGALIHAIFETWLLAAGNANTLLFWICVWMLYEDKGRFSLPAPPRAGWRPPPAPAQ